MAQQVLGRKNATLRLMGRKKGMTRVFDETGKMVPCTVIQAEPNVIVQIKTVEKDGYNALQLGFDKVEAKDPRRKEARTKKPQRNHFKNGSVEPCRELAESRLDEVEGYEVGQELGVAEFKDVNYVDVCGMSIGKGYQGVMKKYGFRGGPAAHGSKFHRHAGSTGMRSTPGRCLPGGPRASHMGHQRKTVDSLQVIKVMEEENVILVKGSIPGPKNGLVYFSQAKKKPVNAN